MVILALGTGDGEGINRSAREKAEIEDRGTEKKKVDKVPKYNNNYLRLPKSSPVKYYFMLRFFHLF